MKKIGTLGLSFILLAACNEVDEPNSKNIRVQEIEQLPVFRLVENGIEEDQVRSLSEQLGIDAGIKFDPSAPISHLDAENFMAVPSRVIGQGKSGEGDGATVIEAFDFAALDGLRPYDSQRATERTLEALHAADMSPDQLLSVSVEAHAEHSTFEAHDINGKELLSVALDTHVLFDLRLDVGEGVPLTGPGAKVKTVFNPEGQVTQLYYGLYGLEEVGTTTAMSVDEAVQACAKAYQGDSEEMNFEPQLTYYIPNAQGKLGELEVGPSYLCRSQADENGEQRRGAFVDATTGQPYYQATLAPERGQAQALNAQRVGRVDVGVEYVGVSQNLNGSKGNANGFAATMSGRGVPVEFHFGDYAAWEQDFKHPGKGGNDSNYVDNVDMVFYTGHANGDGFTFPGNMDDGFLHFDDALWGDRDLEWLVIAACGPLQWDSSGKTYSERWGPAFRGLHQMLAYATDSLDNQAEGRLLAQKLLGVGSNAKRVREAWVETATEVQPSDVDWAIMGPYGSGYTHNYNDYFWGKGTTGSDISNPVGFWRVSGPS